MSDLVIIGSGMAAGRLTQLLVGAGCEERITIIGEEPHPSYNRILLSSVLAGDNSERDLPILERCWCKEHNVNVICGDSVVSIDVDRKQLITSNGLDLSWDKIVFATGSRPLIPNIEGNELAGVLGFRTLQDVELMRKAASEFQRAVVVGGGLLGLEAAHGLNKLGMNVEVVHRNSWVMNRQIDSAAAQLLQQQLESRDIKFHLDRKVKQITGELNVEQVELDDGSRIETDLVVFAAGIRPEFTLAQQTGLDCEQAIQVNSKMQTSNPNIYALGECCEVEQRTFGLVAPIWDQAAVLVEQLTGNTKAEYLFQPSATQLKVSGINLFSAGEIEANESDKVILLEDPASGIYRKLIIEDNHLKGAVLLGDSRGAQWYAELIGSKQNIEAIRGEMMFGQEFSQKAA